MAIWCIMASPLIINYNIFAPEVGTVDPEVVRIVMHDEAIAINQDALGKSAVRSPWAAKSLSYSPHSNVLKDIYDYSCFLARWNEDCHLMT